MEFNEETVKRGLSLNTSEEVVKVFSRTVAKECGLSEMDALSRVREVHRKMRVEHARHMKPRIGTKIELIQKLRDDFSLPVGFVGPIVDEVW